MLNIDENYPQFIRMDKEVKEKYLEPLISQRSSMFFSCEQGDVYFVAAAIGYKNKLHQKTKKSTDVRTYHGLTNELKLFIRVIALSESKYDYKTLENGTAVLKIIEEYANAGMSLLYDKIFIKPDFSLKDEVFPFGD